MLSFGLRFEQVRLTCSLPGASRGRGKPIRYYRVSPAAGVSCGEMNGFDELFPLFVRDGRRPRLFEVLAEAVAVLCVK